MNWRVILFWFGVIGLGTTIFMLGVARNPFGLILSIVLMLPYMHQQYKKGEKSV